MLQRILKWLRFPVSTIGPALDRYYIFPRVKIHRIHSSDEEFHTHPWNGLSIIFGSYTEQIRNKLSDGTFQIREERRFGINYVSAHTEHKVITKRPVWTLFIHGPRINENWHYGDTDTPWKGSDDERKSSTNESVH